MRLRIPWTFIRYFTSFLLVHVALTFVGVLGIFILLDLVDNLRAYTRFGAGGKEIALMYFYRLPELMGQLAPAALLIGSLLSVYRFARRRELTAIEVAGIPPLYSLGCVLLLGIGITLCHLISEMEFLPRFREKADNYSSRVIARTQTPLSKEQRWFLYRDELWYLRFPSPELHLLRFRISEGSFFVEEFFLSPSDPSHLSAKGFRFPPLIPYSPEVTAPEIRAILKMQNMRPPTYMGLSEIWEELIRRGKRGEDPFPLQLELLSRLSWALLNLTVILATLPFLPHHGKRAEAAKGIFVATGIAVCGWVLITIGGAVATSDRSLLGLFLPHFGLLSMSILGRFVRK